jgi:hypothetical protein
MYAIVSFDNTNETDFIPVKWVKGDLNSQELHKKAEKRNVIEVYWPPWKSIDKVRRAKRSCAHPELDWQICSAGILSIGGI